MANDPSANPLTEPGKNLPGVETADGEDVGYPNARQQTYYEAGGPREKGEKRQTSYTSKAGNVDTPPTGGDT
jgi:hypothetical protein